MEVQKGLRVVRGPAWSWGDQDGGEGYLGTVVDAQSSTTDRQGEGEVRGVIVTVQWDRGNRCRYRCGVDDKYDLRVFENSPVVPPHPNISCDECSQDNAMAGMRWKCARCYDYDLCTPCYMSGKHIVEHEFVRFDTVHTRTRVPPRHSARKVEARGIFPGAEVVISHEWSQGDHNSGGDKPGKVIHLEGWEDESHRSAVQVEWHLTHQKSKCRVGHEGKVDLKCTVPASGGDYYPEHLPVLGAPLMPPNPQEFSTGDYVKVELDLDVLRLMQQGHGGWNEHIATIRGQLGVIHHVLDNGDLSVIYGSRTWTLNPVAVVKVDVPQYASGDVVRIMDDMAEVRKLQQGHGEWIEDMVDAVGQLGVVKGVNSAGVALVIVKGRPWIFNPLCLSAAPDEKVPNVQDTVLGHDATLLRMSMLDLIEKEDSEFLGHAALLGEESAIRDYLQKYPNEVNAQVCRKAPIHCAAAAGRVSILKLLLEFQANLEIEDEDGLRPLHHCAARKEAEAAAVLLDAGADPNSKSHDGNTAITTAAMNGSNDVLALLAKHPKIDLSAQDSDGDTALHCAVHAKKHRAVKILLEAGADPTLVNFQLITPIHLAANLGFMLAVEEFVTCAPQHLNLRVDEGLTPLHVAAIANRYDIVTYLAEQKHCEIDSRTVKKHTPLHMAIMRGNSRSVECLVGHGASLNAADCDEDTALHLILSKREVDAPSSETPELKKVQEALGQQDSVIHPGIIVACFFVQEGADIHLTNKKGLTPLQGCSESPEIIAKVLEFAEKHPGTGTFRGSLHSSATKSPTPVQPTSADGSDLQAVQTKEVEPKEKQPTSVAPSSEKCPTEASRLSPPLTDSVSTVAAPSPVKPSPAKQERKYENEHTQTDRAELCILCDTPITVKFQPCEHSVVCEDCARRASKCPDCKTPIQAVIRL